MFSKLFSRVRQIVAVVFVGVGLTATTFAQDNPIDACFNFLNAQDYARAESTAADLLKRNDLSREAQRATNLCLGRAYNGAGRMIDALPAFQQVEQLSETTEELATAYNWLGNTYNGLGELDRAELYFQRSLKAHRERGDKRNEAIALSSLASLVQARGDVDRALKLYQESLALQVEADKSTTLNNIALIHAGRGNFGKAVEMLRQAIEIDQRNGDAHRAAKWRVNLGDTLRQNNKLDEAEKELTAGLNAIRLLGDKHGEAEACVELAALAVDKNKPVNGLKMREWLTKAEVLYRELGDAKNANQIAGWLGKK